MSKEIKNKEVEIYDKKDSDFSRPKWGEQWNKGLMDYLEEIGIKKQLATSLPQYLNNKKILVLGCGNSDDIRITMEYSNDITGIDISPKEIEKVRERINNPEVKLLVMDAENMDFENDTFDVVFCKSVLHHLPNLEKSFQEIHRVLKLGGMMFIAKEPILWNPVAAVGRKFFPTNIHTPGEKPFIPYQFNKLVKKYFRIKNNSYFYFITPALPIILKKIKLNAKWIIKYCYVVEKLFSRTILNNFYWVFSGIYEKK